MPPAPRTECLVCGAGPITSGAVLCRGDLGILARDLADVADVLADLETTTVRRSRTTPASPRRGSGSPLPWGEAASAARRRLAAVLTDEAARAGISAPDPAAAARSLRRALPALRRDPGVGAFGIELRAAVAEARRVIDTPDEVARFPVGPCPETVPAPGDEARSVSCPGRVWARIGAANRPSIMRCPSCEATWNSTEWLRAGRRILARMGAAPA